MADQRCGRMVGKFVRSTISLLEKDLLLLLFFINLLEIVRFLLIKSYFSCDNFIFLDTFLVILLTENGYLKIFKENKNEALEEKRPKSKLVVQSQTHSLQGAKKKK